MAARPVVFGALSGLALIAYFCDKIHSDKKYKLAELDRLGLAVRQEVVMRPDAEHRRSLGCGTLAAYRDRLTEGVASYFRD
jgi:hypothetical protein